eukprot:3933716-Rhodomonas_salina.1
MFKAYDQSIPKNARSDYQERQDVQAVLEKKVTEIKDASDSDSESYFQNQSISATVKKKVVELKYFETSAGGVDSDSDEEVASDEDNGSDVDETGNITRLIDDTCEVDGTQAEADEDEPSPDIKRSWKPLSKQAKRRKRLKRVISSSQESAEERDPCIGNDGLISWRRSDDVRM